jgi:hypothetical protein
MMFTSVSKVEEGLYEVTSKPCPDCTTTVSLQISGHSLYLANQGALVQFVLPNQTADVRERFVSGYCSTCWNTMFDFDDEEE